MKKNTMMRIASVLLVVVLLTTSVISGTFAKYVTSDTGSDTARVADWGVYATVTGNAFKTEYDRTDTSYTNTSTTVVSSTDDKLVAPGTNGTFGGLALTGSPEVATRVSFDGTVVDLTGWTLSDTTYYCPIEFNINGTVIKGIEYNSETALEAAIRAAIVKGAGDYAPNTDLGSIDALVGEYTWNWAYETGANEAEKQANNLKDTELGNLEAESDSIDVNTITITVVTTITQID
ncbi:MAG: hypothetical protein IKK71_04915 [Clostridia bacterium]|nr:hypothetical protein [Clostridia bacterium]